jgi:hypothetical protein
MNRKSAFALLLLGFVAACATSESPAPATPGPDGLLSVRSDRIDQLYLRPGSDIVGYRKVMLDPVAVELSSDWVKQQHGNNYRIQPTYPRYKDAGQVAQEAAESVSASLARAFRAAGVEIVGTPGPGVMRVAAKVNELYINAPDIVSPGYARNLTRDAGEATLLLEARDAASGTLLARVVHHAIARQTPRANLASDPLNTLWMETLFDRWAQSCAAELSASQRAPLSLRN